MTNEFSPITPSPELVQEWRNQWWFHFDDLHPAFEHNYEKYVIAQAAQWGRDQRGAANEAELQQARDEELEAMLAELKALHLPDGYVNMLRAARRPKPPSEADLALEALREAEVTGHLHAHNRRDKIRRALEHLKELEGAS